MGKQEGLIKISGQMGGVSFYKGKDGYFARQKGAGLTADRIKNDPALERIRENNAEFGRAGKAGKLIRTALRSLLVSTADSRMSSRLTRELMRVIQADITNHRGKRNVIDGEAELLTGFEFNAEAPLGSIFLAAYGSQTDRIAGTLTIEFEEFVPAVMIKAPVGATHFRMISAAAEINFEEATYIVTPQFSPMRELVPVPAQIDPLINQVTPGFSHPVLLVLGIEFYQRVNGEHYPLKNGATNALTVIKVEVMA